MINEETIKQTRFYDHINGETYLVKEIKTVSQIRMMSCESGEEFRTILGGEDCEDFAPVDVQFQAQSQPGEPEKPETLKTPRDRMEPSNSKKKAGRKVISKKKSAQKSHKNSSTKRQGAKKPFSEYKGVTRGNPKKDGTVRYRANVWDGKINKNVLVGIFENEILAAAAVAEHKGNKDEAKRLRGLAGSDSTKAGGSTKQQKADMAEQRENNPDRSSAAERKKKGKIIYVCKRCGCEWQTKPKYCPASNCGHDDFREVPGG